MLAKRIIPTILVRGKTAYKGERFVSTRSIGSAVGIARVHAARGADELVILDVAATAEGRGPDLGLVRELSEGCFIPITVGGGVRSLGDIDALLRAGADKVCIGKAAETVIRDAWHRFGRQAIMVSVDAVAGAWRRNQSPAWWAQHWAAEGAGEILLQSIDRDGMLSGYDLDLIREVSAAVGIPVIASGGCGTYEHMLVAFKAGADACAAGAMWAWTDATPRGAAQYLKANGIEVRL